MKRMYDRMNCISSICTWPQAYQSRINSHITIQDDMNIIQVMQLNWKDDLWSAQRELYAEWLWCLTRETECSKIKNKGLLRVFTFPTIPSIRKQDQNLTNTPGKLLHSSLSPSAQWHPSHKREAAAGWTLNPECRKYTQPHHKPT